MNDYKMYKGEFISLSVPLIDGKEWVYVKDCLDTGWVSSSGSYLERFEKEICRYTKAKYAVACINGTAGLKIALQLAGVKAGNEVIVPTLTFIATVNSVKYLNAEPVFMDCDNYLNLDPVKLEEFCNVECKLTGEGLKNKKTGKILRAIVPVHIFGNPCNMSEIMRIARKYQLKVIEDAAESLGSYFKTGIYKNKYTGTIGDLGVYSFNGNKIITSGGGGMIVTNNFKMAEKARYLITQAKDDPVRNIHHEAGYNYRLSNLQAALGVAQLEKLEKYIRIKKKNYCFYARQLENIKGISFLEFPAGSRPNYWFYSILIDKNKYGLNREKLMSKFESAGIQTRPIWYLNHLQKPYRNNLSYKIEKAVYFWQKVLNIPCSVNLGRNDIKRVISVIKKGK